MKVELLTSPASLAEMERNAALAALTCHDNADKEHVPAEVLMRIIKLRHESVLEHITLTYRVVNITRALLQEVSRHRHISLSVESTRHTLRKKLNSKFELDFLREGASGEWLKAIENIKRIADTYPEVPNDELKYFLPEFWPTSLVLTSNIRELRHILNLRTAPAALKEFRCLARAMFEAVPEEFKYLLRDCVHEEASNE